MLFQVSKKSLGSFWLSWLFGIVSGSFFSVLGYIDFICVLSVRGCLRLFLLFSGCTVGFRLFQVDSVVVSGCRFATVVFVFFSVVVVCCMLFRLYCRFKGCFRLFRVSR